MIMLWWCSCVHPLFCRSATLIVLFCQSTNKLNTLLSGTPSSEGGAGFPGQPGRENTGGEREDEENEKALASGILGVLAPAV